MRRFFLFAFGFSIAAFAIASRLTAGGATPQAPAIRANDNRLPAGLRVGHVLHLSLDARWGRWYPDGPSGDAVPMQAFAQTGEAPQIPGPVIRVPLGTVVIARVHNAIPGSALTVHGLMDRPALRDRPFDVPFAQTRVIRFRAGAVGTYYYWASTTGSAVDHRFRSDSQLSGAFVVDPPNATQTPHDRIFVIGQWFNVLDATGAPDFAYELDVINGRTWPHTERLSYRQGASVHWRVINTSAGGHPLHLHGFFFRVDSRGDGVEDVIYRRDSDRDRRVTELVEPGGTFTMTWKASRVGNWLFHCHLTYHTMGHLPISEMLRGKPAISGDEDENHFLRRAGMGGLILAIAVRAPRMRAIVEPPVARRLGLLVEPAPDDRPDAPSFRYVLDDGGKTVTELGAVGPPIVLTRGVCVAIDVTDRLQEPTSVHWHGIELQDSYYDGVAGYSGEGDRLEPMIDPGQTFEARLVPPRAGTFIYHTHMDDVYQLRAGLAGPLIVLDPGERFDPATDHIFTITTTHSLADGLKIFVNGVLQPQPLRVRAGVPQRLRFINITTFWTNVIVSLSSGSQTLEWRPVAVDGADLPAVRRFAEPAVGTVTIGGTEDFTFTLARGDALLQIWPAQGLPPVTIPVHAT